jgi:murein DD-endopeptidase MepM/ murein hydrolase activator NlpD
MAQEDNDERTNWAKKQSNMNESTNKTNNRYRLPIDLEHVTRVQSDSIAHVGELMHAIDYDAPEGTDIYSALTGIVVDVKDDSNLGGLDQSFEGHGNYIEILHDNGEVSEYEHLKQHSSRVRIGDRVESGQKIAEVGNTGWSECPHLHVMVYPKQSPYRTLEIVFI